MRYWIFIVIAVVLGVGVWWMTPWFTSSPIIDIRLYGTSGDPTMRRVEEVLQNVRTKFGARARITIHYLALRDSENNLGSLLGSEATADLEENARRLVMRDVDDDRFWTYLRFRDDGIAYPWQSAALAAGFSVDDIETRIRSASALQIREIEQWDTFIAERNEPLDAPVFPRLYINDVLYRGPVDVMSIASVVARTLLHNKLQTSIFGVAACASDIHCDDRPREVGKCVDVGTLRAHCEYAEAQPVTLYVLIDKPFAPNEDRILAQLYATVQNLMITTIDVKSKGGVELKKEFKLTTFPAYFFDQSIQTEQNFFPFLQSGLIAADKRGWYRINVQPNKKE